MVRINSKSIVSVALLTVFNSPLQALDLANVPLFLTPGIDPNVMFIIDDSGSMQFELMPDDIIYEGARFVFPRADSVYGSSDYNNRVPTVDSNEAYNALARSPQVNTLYYNPGVTYTPWTRHDGLLYPNASVTCAWHNPEQTGSCPSGSVNSRARNLTRNNGRYNSNRWYECNSNGNCDDSSSDKTFWPATYFWHNGGDIWRWNNYSRVEIRSETPNYTGHGRENRNDCVDRSAGRCTYAEEIQNFANWYTYYRSRILAARAGIGKAFAPLGDNMRLGFGSINKSSSSVDNVNTDTIVRGVRQFSGSNREQFYEDLYTRDIPAAGTPLRQALDSAGQYFSRDDSRGPYSSTPGSRGGEQLSCRQNYTVLMTDGYWSGGSSYEASTSAARANVDNSSGPSISGPSGASFRYRPADPFRDSNSNTLADVAMYYWNRDLRSDLVNNVPINNVNTAFWQHMVTFGVGLGVSGSVDPQFAWNALATGAEINWPNPSPGTQNCSGSTCPARLDDLLHAAVNSRGGFFSAADPATFASEMASVLNTIIGRNEASASAVAANATRLDTGSLVYQAKFDARDWSGQLLAMAIDENTGVVDTDTPNWEAAERLPAPDFRRIYTIDPDAVLGARGLEFLWDRLTDAQQLHLNSLNGSEDGQGVARLEWLRGDNSDEQRLGGNLRNRIKLFNGNFINNDADLANPNIQTNVLGDIVNSDPIYVEDQDFGYSVLPGTEGSSYTTFRNSDAYRNRRPMIYVGANDGMLHGFDARKNVEGQVTSGGNEVFAYIPNALFSELSQLTSPSYNHRYYVDGMSAAGDAYFDSSWHTLLAGTTAAGGRAVFALDVTYPDSFGVANVLWEFTDRQDADLGYTFAQPSIARLHDGSWAVIVGNGYNSDNGHAVLFILNAKTGAIIKKIDTGFGGDNGLSSPLVVDSDGDRVADYVYAGDLKGNLWKFNITSSNSVSWDVAFKQGDSNIPLFVACTSIGTSCSAENRQPITSQPNVGSVGEDQSGGSMVYFGTGKYIEIGDNDVSGSPQIQSFYGLWDRHTSPIDNRDELQLQSIVFEGTATTKDGVTTSNPIRVTSENPVCYSSESAGCDESSDLKSGWVMNLQSPSNGVQGERVVSRPLVRRGLVIFSTTIPNSDPCSYGGTGWLMELDAFSGGQPDSPPFDLSGDNKVDEEDIVIIDGVEHTASGLDVLIGIHKTPGVIEADSVDYKYLSGSTGEIGRVVDAGGGSDEEDGPAINRRSWRQLR
ncbi:MAG: PilC/PilY family type IV pilus protein [Methylomicrobium sp.]